MSSSIPEKATSEHAAKASEKATSFHERKDGGKLFRDIS
jgi:hypothetical protein